MKGLTKITRNNLKRIHTSINNAFKTCECCNLPLPSWVEISLIDYCTRKCIFCPRSNPKNAPNQKHLFMSIGLIKKIVKDLSDIKFKGTIIFSGYGEPLTSPNILLAVKELSTVSRIEIVTNGDLLTQKMISNLYKSGTSFISVSLYDGFKQKNKFEKIFKTLKISENRYILRDRKYTPDEDFGKMLTNRAGLIHLKNQKPVLKTAQCFYPHYAMVIDWNGDVLLCTHDWNKKIKCGNIAFSTIHDIWIGPVYKKYRDFLNKGNRIYSPCSECNCEGILHGKSHANYWKKYEN